MDISIKRVTPAKQKTACFIVAINSGKTLRRTALALDKSSRKAISSLTARGDISGKVGETLLLPTAPGVSADRILLVGAGKNAGIKATHFVKIAKKDAAIISANGYRNALSALTEIEVIERDLAWKLRQLAIAFADAGDQYSEHN